MHRLTQSLVLIFASLRRLLRNCSIEKMKYSYHKDTVLTIGKSGEPASEVILIHSAMTMLMA